MERTTYDVRIRFYSRLIKFLMINLMLERGLNLQAEIIVVLPTRDVTPKICYSAGLNINQCTVHFYYLFVNIKTSL